MHTNTFFFARYTQEEYNLLLLLLAFPLQMEKLTTPTSTPGSLQKRMLFLFEPGVNTVFAL